MAILDNVQAGIVQLKVDADAATARWVAANQANVDALTALQAVVVNMQAQLDAAVVNQADPVVVAQLESDIAAIDSILAVLGV